MKTIKKHSSFVTIKNILDRNGFTALEHKSINFNGIRNGFSGFWKNNENGKIIYINTDIEFNALVHGTVLVRTAESTKDTKGGFNNFVNTDEELIKKAKWLTSDSFEF